MNKVKSQNYFFIGAMSGTSIDGLDLVYVKFTKTHIWDFKVLASKTHIYNSNWVKKLGDAINLSSKILFQLDVEYSSFLADQILTFIEDFKIDKLDGVGSHGHTVFHRPDEGFTYQIGNLPLIANKIKKPLICDFRAQDVFLGGQGAPLVPIGDKYLFKDYDGCLNLGGFSNITIKKGTKLIAYDICALNAILNSLANQLNLDYDDGGKEAKKGKLIDNLYSELEHIAFYKLKPPKSLGIEWVKENLQIILKKYSDKPVEDLLCTYTTHSANQIAKNLNNISSVLVTGGGTYNSFLISKIKQRTNCEIIIPSTDIINYKEAIIFAFLSVLKIRGEVNCFASVTGSKHDHSSGKIFFPNPIID